MLKIMEFTVKDNDYKKFFESYEPNDILRRNFEDLKTKFDEIMPPINFIDNISLVETLKNNVRTIYTFHHAYGHDRFVPFCNLLTNPKEFISNYLGVLEEAIRHQGKIWPQTYYWLVFIVELLSRDFDDFESDKLPLKYQLYLENYVTSPLISFYSDNHFCTFCFNDYASSNGIEVTDTDDLVNEHNVTKKMIALVEYQINKNKSKLMKLCKTEKITPIRALWLYSVPLSFEEISDLIQNIKNKYIRASLFWVAGFQQIELIKNLIMNNTEKDAFEMGMQSIITYNLRLANKKLNYLNKDFDNNYEPIGDIKQFNFYYNYCHSTEYLINKDKAINILNNTPHDKVSHKEIYDLLTNNTNKNSQYNDDELKIKTDYQKTFSYHPFYISNFWLENIDVGGSATLEYYTKYYKGLANEYKNYYNNNFYKSSHFIDENEDTNYIFIKDGILKLI